MFDFIGYTRAEFAELGNQLAAIIEPEDFPDVVRRLREQLRQAKTIHIENRLRCKDGSVKWASVKAQLFMENDESLFDCVFIDITEEKQLRRREKELYERELRYFVEAASGNQSGQGPAERDAKSFGKLFDNGEFRRSPGWATAMIR